MDLILISSAGLWTGALAADHFGRRPGWSLRRWSVVQPAGQRDLPRRSVRRARRWGRRADQSALVPRRRRPASRRPAPTNGLRTGPSPSTLRRQPLAVSQVPTGLPGHSHWW